MPRWVVVVCGTIERMCRTVFDLERRGIIKEIGKPGPDGVGIGRVAQI